VISGFAMQPSKDVCYLRTRTLRGRVGEAATPEHDCVAIRLELVRLWLLFIPTMFAVAFLVISSASGKFAGASLLNRVANLPHSFPAAVPIFQLATYVPMAVVAILWLWVSERWALRSVEACSAAHCEKRGKR
jgi:hypothetical protein